MEQSAIIISLNTWMSSYPILSKIIPLLADIFVFSYPIYLIYLYFFTTDRIKRWQKLSHQYKDRLHKYNALSILFSFIWSIAINYIIKAFIEQPRPYQVLHLTTNPKESLILNSIPTDSFPSDHAAVGMTIAITTLLLWYHHKNKKIIAIWRIFLCFAMIMDISRITIWVHRPVDIVAGSVIWAIVAMIINYNPIQKWLSTYIFDPIINLQEYIFNKLCIKRK